MQTCTISPWHPPTHSSLLSITHSYPSYFLRYLHNPLFKIIVVHQWINLGTCYAEKHGLIEKAEKTDLIHGISIFSISITKDQKLSNLQKEDYLAQFWPWHQQETTFSGDLLTYHVEAGSFIMALSLREQACMVSKNQGRTHTCSFLTTFCGELTRFSQEKHPWWLSDTPLGTIHCTPERPFRSDRKWHHYNRDQTSNTEDIGERVQTIASWNAPQPYAFPRSHILPHGMFTEIQQFLHLKVPLWA